MPEPDAIARCRSETAGLIEKADGFWGQGEAPIIDALGAS